MRPAVMLALLALLAPGCGADEAAPRLWLVDGYVSALGLRGTLEPVERERAVSPARALGELLKGPITAEREGGLVTGFPAGVLLESMAVAGGTARVRLAAPARAAREAGVYATAQIVYTLTEFPEVNRVVLTLNGRPCCLYRHSGRPVRGPLTRADFRGWQGDPFPPSASEDAAPAVRSG